MAHRKPTESAIEAEKISAMSVVILIPCEVSGGSAYQVVVRAADAELEASSERSALD